VQFDILRECLEILDGQCQTGISGLGLHKFFEYLRNVVTQLFEVFGTPCSGERSLQVLFRSFMRLNECRLSIAGVFQCHSGVLEIEEDPSCQASLSRTQPFINYQQVMEAVKASTAECPNSLEMSRAADRESTSGVSRQ
jgi:hypothetical protein